MVSKSGKHCYEVLKLFQPLQLLWRLFSVAEKTFRPERCRLGDKTFETLMMIKTNAASLVDS